MKKSLLFFFSSLLFARLFASSIPDLATMSLEEKVGQTLIVHFIGEEVNADAHTLVNDVKVGGIIYYNWANGLHNPEQVQKLSNELQQLTQLNPLTIPLLLTVDQEGGAVSRLTKGFTQFPGNRALSTTDEATTRAVALAMGQELKAVGVNMNLAPVVDIASNPQSSIGMRSFGGTPESVVKFAQASLEGYRQAHTITSLKHFPNYGEAFIDAHEDLPMLCKSQDELRHHDLIPYRALMKEADAIMTGHIMVPAFDPDYCATLSSILLEDLLRKEMGYQGVLISDSLVMEGLLKNCGSIEEGAIRAFNAGCDLLILGGKQLIGHHKNLELTVADVQRIANTLCNAVRNGQISEEKLNAAVQRILQLKMSYDLFSFSFPTDDDIKHNVATKEHTELAQAISQSVLTIVGKDNSIFDLNQKKIAVIAPSLVQDNIYETNLHQTGQECRFLFYDPRTPSNEEKTSACELAEWAEVIIACCYNAWRSPEQELLIKSLTDTQKQVFLLCLRDPQDALLFPSATMIITTLSPTSISIQAALNLLSKK